MKPSDMYKVKKKRAVDPNAPPRPNLLSHEKVLKDTKLTIEQQAEMIHNLQRRIAELEAKTSHQGNYLNTLHSHITNLMRRK